jgi:hydrogenase expression/formation protein HypE
LSEGSGGAASHRLVQDCFVKTFDNPWLYEAEDQARLDLQALCREGDRLAFCTDASVVSPLFFPGADIGTLAVCGTVNDLAVGGALPRYLACSFVIEEGLPRDSLQRVVDSMAASAAQAGVYLVAGDTKVVPRGAADGLFISTSGVGVIPAGRRLGGRYLTPGDSLVVSGSLGNHGVAVSMARDNLGVLADVRSDCAPLNSLVECLLAACPAVRAIRDITRGGLVAVLNEWALAASVHLQVSETDLPVEEAVRGYCELLGLDPLHLANEGKLLVAVPAAQTDQALAALRSHPLGRGAVCAGRVLAAPAGLVSLRTVFGAERLLDMPEGELLPRIC